MFNRIYRFIKWTILLSFCLLLTLAQGGWSQPSLSNGCEPYESYFLFHGAYPDQEGTPYADEFQGLTHDQDNWFLSSNTHEGELKVPQLWKVPVQYDLRHVTDNQNQYPGVIRRRISETPLAQLGYNHFGDISYYRYRGQGYIIVPVEKERPYTVPNVFAFFRANDLAYVNMTSVPDFGACRDPEGRSLGWVAVDPDGNLYSSGDCTQSIYKFSLNWGDLPNKPVNLTLLASINLLDEDGAPLMLGRTQGGVFSESGRLFYIVSGSESSVFQYRNDGISVFDTQTWCRVAQSTNGFGHFNYRYSAGFPAFDEPEGLTIWDLDDGRAPGFGGQLHVGMLDNELGADDVYLYHYINTIYVDSSYAGEETGEPHKPFNTVGEANDLAWNGARIKIKPVSIGPYWEALTFSKRIQLLAGEGGATIGMLGRVRLTTKGAINICSGGSLKIY